MRWYRQRARKFFRDKRDLGDASDLDVNLVDLEFAETLREHETIASERERTRLELNQLRISDKLKFIGQQ